MSSPKKVSSSSSSDNPDQYLISGSLEALGGSIEKSVSSSSVPEGSRQVAQVPLQSVTEEVPVYSKAQIQGEGVSTSVPEVSPVAQAQEQPAITPSSTEAVVPPTPQTQGELVSSEEQQRQKELEEKAKEEERLKRIQEKVAGKRPATTQVFSRTTKLLSSSMNAELLLQLQQENQGTTQEEIEAIIAEEREVQRTEPVRPREGDGSSKITKRRSVKQAAKRKAPEPVPEKRVTKAAKVTKASKKAAVEQEEEPVERQKTKKVVKKVSKKTGKGKEKAAPAKKPVSKKRRARTPSLSPSDSSSSSEDTESDRAISEDEFNSSEDEAFKFAEQRKYALKIRTHGEKIKQKSVKPTKEDIVLVKKLPKLGKGYVPQDLKKNSHVDLRILRWEHGNPYRSKRTATDERFWTSFQQDYYQTVISTLNTIIAPMKWIDWNSIEEINTLRGLKETCITAKIKNLLEFSFDWSEELVMQFYATFFMEGSMDGNPLIFWMTHNKPYSIDRRTFCEILGLPFEVYAPGSVDNTLTRTDMLDSKNNEELLQLFYFHEEFPCTCVVN